MKCQEVTNKLESYLASQLLSNDTKVIEEHLTHCQLCAKSLLPNDNELEHLLAGDWYAQMPENDLVIRVMSQLPQHKPVLSQWQRIALLVLAWSGYCTSWFIISSFLLASRVLPDISSLIHWWVGTVEIVGVVSNGVLTALLYTHISPVIPALNFVFTAALFGIYSKYLKEVS